MDEQLAGRSGIPFEIVIEPGKVREFARALGSVDPTHIEGTLPISPPTFLVTEQFWSEPANQAIPDGALNWERLLHGQQEFVFHGPPPRAGARLTGSSRVDRVYEKHGKRGGVMTLLDLVTEYRDETGALVAESRSTLLETSAAADG